MDVQVKPGSLPPGAPSRKLVTVLDSDGRADPEHDPKLDLALGRRIYEAMLRTRAIDARLMKLQRQGRIGFHVGCEGEEAAIIASAAAMRDQVTAKQQRFTSITAPIGTQITQAVGFAWAAKIRKQDIVTASYFGDGAT